MKLAKKFLCITALISSSYAVTIIDSPKEGESVVVSNKSVNRIVLPYQIKDLAYSKEKGLIININENQAFIKYMPVQKDVYAADPNDRRNTPIQSEIIYSRAKPAEVFFITSGKTYSFSLIPKNVKTQTIIINDYIKDKKVALKYETSNNYTSTISDLVKKIHLDNTPKGYKVKEYNKVYSKNHIRTITLKQTHEGALYKAYLFEVKNNTSVTRKIDEKEFFKYVENNPLAISVFFQNEFNEFLPHSNVQVVVVTKVNQ